jgi:Cys-tRNA(Pro)/Cys-tRNA(Cys) deacylase
MAASTPALAALQRAGVDFITHSYELVESDLSYGAAVAATLGVDPGRLFKTLVAECDSKPVVAIVPVRSHLSLKALAKAAASKKAHMADPVAAERWTGYVVGGISPFAQKRRMPVFLDESAVGFQTIYVSAGLRGLQVELDPVDLIRMLECRLAALAD